MKVKNTREIIIEFERIRIIRKRARTSLEFCGQCRTEADFISFDEAATLFNTDPELLFQFINNTGSHYQTKGDGEIFICLKSLIARMKTIKSEQIKQLPSR